MIQSVVALAPYDFVRVCVCVCVQASVVHEMCLSVFEHFIKLFVVSLLSSKLVMPSGEIFVVEWKKMCAYVWDCESLCVILNRTHALKPLNHMCAYLNDEFCCFHIKLMIINTNQPKLFLSIFRIKKHVFIYAYFFLSLRKKVLAE